MTSSSSSYRKRIYTKFGDLGETSLLYGGRISKNNLHTEAYGITDEAVSAMGLARALSESLAAPGPALVHLRIAPGSIEKLGRPTISPPEVARRFRAFLAGA